MGYFTARTIMLSDHPEIGWAANSARVTASEGVSVSAFVDASAPPEDTARIGTPKTSN